MTDRDTVLETRARFGRERWFSLPLKLRVRWWQETDYGQKMPSDALMTEISGALGESASTSKEDSQ